MWQPGETIHFSASQHVKAIHRHAKRKLIDCVVLNTALIPRDLKKKYARAHVQPVDNDFSRLAKMGVKVVTHLIREPNTDAQKIATIRRRWPKL